MVAVEPVAGRGGRGGNPGVWSAVPPSHRFRKPEATARRHDARQRSPPDGGGDHRTVKLLQERAGQPELAASLPSQLQGPGPPADRTCAACCSGTGGPRMWLSG